VRVARVEPERRIEQLLHRRQQALTRKIEIASKPAVLAQEADELFGGSDIGATFNVSAK
jgi:hypothetical protein